MIWEIYIKVKEILYFISGRFISVFKNNL